MPPTKGTKAAKSTAAQAFTEEERAAMKERSKEVKSARRGGKVDGEADLLAKIAEMGQPYRDMAERIHAIVMENGPDLEPKTWYGQPAWAKGGKVVCFFQSAEKFKTRYSTLGFNEEANLDEGGMWPTSWALAELSAADEKRIAELVRKAVS